MGGGCGQGIWGGASRNGQVKGYVFWSKDGARFLHGTDSILARVLPAQQFQLLAVERLNPNLR
jgi:hypothetical protein